MTKIAILSVPAQRGGMSYRAVTGRNQSQGRTAGEALDALTLQLGADQPGMFVVVQNFFPDRFFTEAQQQRLSALMENWRQTQAKGKELDSAERIELDALIEAELRGSAARAAAFADELGE